MLLSEYRNGIEQEDYLECQELRIITGESCFNEEHFISTLKVNILITKICVLLEKAILYNKLDLGLFRLIPSIDILKSSDSRLIMKHNDIL